jgi:SPP1 gp7 family putative phage head morphogenesis protein
VSKKIKYTERQINNLLEAVYEGRITTGELPEDLYFAIAEYLKDGLYKGFGGELTEFGGKNLELLEDLRENIYMFSGAKTYQQVREMTELIANNETFSEFKKDALEVYDKYNVDWLRTEYNTAIGQATQARQWSDIESDKDVFPYLRYSAVMDENTSDICAPLNGVTLPVDDPLWDEYSPLNHFNCRCVLEQIDKYSDAKTTGSHRVAEIKKELDETVQPEFKMNAGKDGYIFSPEHPYFEVAKGDKGFAKQNFDLPIPKDDEE